MKRLLLMMACIASYCVSINCGARLIKKVEKKNMQLCLNTTPNFGTTHFIVGYKEKDTLAKVVNKKLEKKQPKRVIQKKQESIIRGGADLIDVNRNTQSFFTTIHNISDIILRVISQAKKNVYIAAFTLTDARIADLLIEKHKNGLDVCIIVDAGNMQQIHSKVHNLINNNVSVWKYSPVLNPHYKKNGLYEPLMHHKCITVDNELTMTGSTNLTKAGQKNNIENINILRDKQAINEHREEFERLKKYCIKCEKNN